LGIAPLARAEAQVAEEWVARYNGSGSSDDRANDVAVDAAGNVYVTGFSLESGASNYITIKYDANGNQAWLASYNGPGNASDGAAAIAVDSAGNVYVTGESFGSGTDKDYATIKYDPTGTELWVARYNGLDNASDSALAIAIDAGGNVYVTGQSMSSATADYDYATVKYDSNGAELWVARYNGLDGYDSAKSIAVDAGGDVYVTGVSSSVDFSGNYLWYADYATVKYDAAGQELWVARYDAGDWVDVASTVVVDGGGNVYVTGGSYRAPSSSAEYATIKYDPTGATLWVARYPGGGGTRGAMANALAVDGNGNVYVTGGTQGITITVDYATVKYDASGQELWAARYNGPGYRDDVATAMVVDNEGNVYVTGESKLSDSDSDAVTIKYDPNGTLLWIARYDGPGHGLDVPAALAGDANGHVYVTGRSVGSGTNNDAVTIKYSTTTEVMISGAAGDQQTQTVAWNPVDQEYLVLWQDFRSGTPDIYGARLDRDGYVVAGDLPIVTQSAKQAGPSVAYGGGGYLAVWIDQRTSATTGTDVYGAWILPNGTVQSEFVVTDAPANQRAASVVYNPAANNFLVTWIDDRNGTGNIDIWGAVVGSGGVAGTPFAMVTASGNQQGPYARYDYGDNQYYMVWFDNRSGNYDVYGSRVTALGALLDGADHVLTNTAGDQKNPRITDRRPADGITNYVLSWIDFRNGQPDIYGALLDQNGVKIGSDFPIAGGSADERAVSLDLDWVRTKKAVVSWIDGRNGSDYDIYRAQVDQTGMVSGEALVAGAGTGAANQQQGPGVLYSDIGGEDNGFLITWRDYRNGIDYDIWGIKVWP
jgi:hypothetical protein